MKKPEKVLAGRITDVAILGNRSASSLHRAPPPPPLNDQSALSALAASLDSSIARLQRLTNEAAAMANAMLGAVPDGNAESADLDYGPGVVGLLHHRAMCLDRSLDAHELTLARLRVL